tara:strand:- start:1797 stop:2219 length:423 start_codon:yes stop_codon:yes gene_type:complete
MFVIKDESEFPLVKVKFGKEITNYDDLNLFFNLWNKLYQDEKNFTFLLDTSECGKIPIKYSYYMAKKIKEIKKLKKHYLNCTIVILESKWMTKLMKILFGIIKPIAPVYIVKSKKDANDIYFRLSNNLLKSDINYEKISN